MRSKNRNILTALVAVLALAAVTSASASAALPEFTGTFPNKIEVKNGQVVKFDTPLGSWQCVGMKGTGSLTGAKALTMKFTFQNCAGGATESCHTKGAAAGEIKTEELKSAPVYISKANKEVGIDFNQYTGSINKAPVFATFTCNEGKNTETFRGAVIVPITPINIKTKAYKLAFVAGEEKQNPWRYENEEGKLISNYLGGYLRTEELYPIPMSVNGGPELITTTETELKA